MKRISGGKTQGRTQATVESLQDVESHLAALYERLNATISRVNDLLTANDEKVATNTESTFAIDGVRFGVHYVTQTAGSSLQIVTDVTYKPLAEWTVGAILNLIVRNTTGGSLSVVFSTDFAATSAVMPNNTTRSWLLRVTPASWPVRIQEI